MSGFEPPLRIGNAGEQTATRTSAVAAATAERHAGAAEPIARPLHAPRLRAWLRTLIDIGAVVTALVFIGSYFPREVMFSATITNGGDMGSHYYPAQYLSEVLLPRGRVSGWCPGNYGGYPIFQFYFPLAFLCIAGLATVMPLTIAFKLGTVLGTFLLPVCAYASLRLLRVPFPGPALGALTPLCFLFMEANSMWGGNVPSTLAGEFALSLGLALTVLFFGTLRWTMDTGRGALWNGLLVALIGLSHGYTLLWAGFSSLVELVATRRWWTRVGILIVVHGLAILLMAFWLVPLIVYAPWTTAYNHSWPIRSWREVLPPILWPPAIAAVGSFVLVGVVSLVQRRAFPRGLATLWGVMAVAALFYLFAHSFHVVDIRFVPFVQLGLCLAAAAGVGYVMARLPVPEVWPLAVAALLLPFVQTKVTFIGGWIKWNYSGFEKKAPWPVFRAVNEAIRGDFRDPRVVYEHSPEHEALGTVRAFESLPLFSGRSTLEGLYMQGSPTAPFVFYVQSEVSKDQSCPFPDWGCSRFDLDQGLQHLRMMNVSDFIVRSAPVKQAVAKHPGLERTAASGGYEIYRVKDNDGRYAVPLAVEPVLVVTPDWKDAAYRWFKRARPEDPVPVFVAEADDEARRTFGQVFSGLPSQIPAKPLPPPPALHEEMPTQERVVITGARPGQPILIRMSYHPRWRTTTGERVWLAAPSFMLVVPRGERVELVFGDPPAVRVARLLTGIGWTVFALALLPVGRRLGARGVAAGRWLAARQPARPVVGLVERSARWTPGRRRLALAAGLVLAAAALGAAGALGYRVPADQVYRAGQRLYDAGRLGEAMPYFEEARRLAPLSATAIHAGYYRAIILFRQEKWAEAEAAFVQQVETFPEGVNAPESLYHVGLCRARRGNVAGAVQAWESTAARYPGSPWTKYAGDRLAEVRR
jgi:hypothetical protein